MKYCAICGRPESRGNRVENAHITDKGMGGRGPKAPADAHDTVQLCAGTGGNTDPKSCHGANHAGQLRLKRDAAGRLEFCPGMEYTRVLRRRGVYCKDGGWYLARYEDADFDAIDCPREELTR